MAGKIPDVFSTHSAARFCRVTPMTIIRWVEEGRIKAYKTPGGHRRIMRADLEDFCRRSAIPVDLNDSIETQGIRRVLIIDDDTTAVESILDALLDDAGQDSGAAFEVEHTDNPFDGGRLLSSFRPHFVFLSLSMPGLDPGHVAKAIRSDPSTRRARIVGIAPRVQDQPTPEGGVRLLGPGQLDEVLARPIARKAVRSITGPMPQLPRTPDK